MNVASSEPYYDGRGYVTLDRARTVKNEFVAECSGLDSYDIQRALIRHYKEVVKNSGRDDVVVLTPTEVDEIMDKEREYLEK